uniref:Uncharacterized protein n=1 Tax=Arundo donax TaxID=35708 RepID=A0A0A9HTC3_ARUDO
MCLKALVKLDQTILFPSWKLLFEALMFCMFLGPIIAELSLSNLTYHHAI